MGLQPNIQRAKRFALRQCVRCGQSFGPESFAPTKSPFFPDGCLTICDDCIDAYLAAQEWSWDSIDKLCQLVDVPFVPAQWVTMRDMSSQEIFHRYAQVFQSAEYQNLGWGDYQKEYEALKQSQQLEEVIPLIPEARRAELQAKWGKNYDDEALHYLDDLYKGLLATQNVNGKLQKDQAEKICKISYELDIRIREGVDFDKLLSSYDKLVKAADFTPKNVKNINDFDSIGELIKWMEKKGWKNPYYDNVPKDVVDETIANIQAFNQRLYTNESGIGEEITRRIESLKQAEKLERGDYYSTASNIEDLDQYEVDGYNKLVKEEEFSVELEDE